MTLALSALCLAASLFRLRRRRPPVPLSYVSPPTPANGTIFHIQPGQLLTFTIQLQESDPNSSIGFLDIVMPPGAYLNPSAPLVAFGDGINPRRSPPSSSGLRRPISSDSLTSSSTRRTSRRRSQLSPARRHRRHAAHRLHVHAGRLGLEAQWRESRHVPQEQLCGGFPDRNRSWDSRRGRLLAEVHQFDGDQELPPCGRHSGGSQGGCNESHEVGRRLLRGPSPLARIERWIRRRGLDRRWSDRRLEAPEHG